jgi:hypothetical protein
MGKTNKKQRNPKRKTQKSRYRFKRSKVPPRRVNVMRGGFSASFTNDVVSNSPQSYLPYNNFANDPNYQVIAARNTGPFLTGVASGGSRRKRMKNRKMRGGGGEGSAYLSNVMNTVTNHVGIIPAPAINEFSGAAGVMSGFSNTGSVYNSTPAKIAPLA